MEFRALVQVRLGQVLTRFPGVPRPQAGLLALTAVAAIAILIDTPYPDLAPLQNLPTLGIIAGAWAGIRRWPMPTSTIVCLCAFLWLHTIGGRYIYSYVPYDDWARAVGLPAPTEALGLSRNSWDRLVHFSFGLFSVHPIATWLVRYRAFSLAGALSIAVMAVFAGSAAYEIFEWLLTLFMAGPDAIAYNGQQGDPWDPQKDMALAGVGAIVASLCIGMRRR